MSNFTHNVQPFAVDADSPFREQILLMENTHPPNWEHILQMENEYLKLLSSFVFFFSIATYSPFGEQIPQMEKTRSPSWELILQMENEFLYPQSAALYSRYWFSIWRTNFPNGGYSFSKLRTYSPNGELVSIPTNCSLI